MPFCFKEEAEATLASHKSTLPAEAHQEIPRCPGALPTPQMSRVPDVTVRDGHS